jgi:hypothetical protein
VPGHPYTQGFDLRLVPGKLSEPFQWSSPHTVFVNSMSDLFQDDVPDEYIEEVVAVMAEANWHTYQVLTKRSQRLSHLLSTKLKAASQFRHIWWGVSVEDPKYGLPRVKDLQAAPVAVKFLSIEPLLADIAGFELPIPLGGLWAWAIDHSGPLEKKRFFDRASAKQGNARSFFAATLSRDSSVDCVHGGYDGAFRARGAVFRNGRAPGRRRCDCRKDFRVCWAFRQIFSNKAFEGRLLFKGGTSLSKI